MGNKKERYKLLKNIAYHVLLALWYVLSLLPLRVLYVLSDLLYVLTYHVIRYRRNVVRENLRTSFPEKSEAEIKRCFYDACYLCLSPNEQAAYWQEIINGMEQSD